MSDGALPAAPAVPAVPRAARYVSWVGLVAGVLLTFFGAVHIGVTWDEPLHVQRYNNYAQTGWYLGDGQLVDGEPAPAMKQQYVYGPATMLLLHGLGVATGVEETGRASTSADAYTVRHLGVAAISVLGLLAIICTGRLLFRRWDWGVLAGAVLALLPMWTGHAMFNLKDVPVAAGYSWVTFGLALLVRGRSSGSLLVRLAGPAAIAGGTYLAVGTRPGMWVTIFASTVAFVGCLLLRPGRSTWRDRFRGDLWRYRDLVAGYLVAAIGLYLIYPSVFGSPLAAMSHAAHGSADFIGTTAPWYFIPARVALQVPLLMLGFMALGFVVGVRRFVSRRLQLDASDTRLVLVFVQVFTLPLIAMIHGASLYSDLRQVLFAAPAAALLVTFGMARLTAAAGRLHDDPYAIPLVAATTCAALVVPLVDQAMLFPYDYTYYNPLVAVSKVSGIGDYYRSSGRELAPYLPPSGRIVCSPEGDKKGPRRQAHLDGWVDCRDPSSSPIAPYVGRFKGKYPPLAADEFWVITFVPSGIPPSNCTTVHLIHRRTLFRHAAMGQLARCERAYSVLGTRPVRITATNARSFRFLDLGWRSPLIDADPDGVLARGKASSLTFLLAPELRGAPVVLELGVEARSAVRASFGGTEVPVSGGPGSSTLSITIPARLADEATRVAQTLELRSADGSDLDLRLTSVGARLSPDRARTPTPGRAASTP